MKPVSLLPLLSFVLAAATLPAAETFENAMARAALDYNQRLRTASDELARMREQIAREKAPTLQAMRAAEDRIIAADREVTRIETAQEQSQETRRRIAKDADTLRKNESYLTMLAHDGLKAYGDGLAPGEGQLVEDRVQELLQKLDDPAKPGDARAAMAAADFLVEQVQRSVGGYIAAGSAMMDGDNQVVKGSFAFAGPETYFRADQNGSAGTVRAREGAGYPVVYVLSGWKPSEAEALFQGRPGTVLADASAGKALRLRETKGTVWEHVRKGGVVAYAILGVGLASLLMIVQKIRDLTRMRVDSAPVVEEFLGLVASGGAARAQQALGSLRATTRELFTVGLRHLREPKTILEEHLVAVVLRQRLFYERWLPLLAVIATAAPLMGLLGTVTGLVRTFALITVFGTGNAGKLASGISEVLVATELGLMVAIPTLVAHGFLSHRIQKNLSLLERHALEFATAAQLDKSRVPAKEAVVP
jgi:biopolymer transport protein ExbB